MRIISKCIFRRKRLRGGWDWIYLAQDRDKWRVLANMVKNFEVHKLQGILD
jgi:hypothetical protein